MSLKVDGHFSGLRPNCDGDAYKDSGSKGRRKIVEEDGPPPFRVPHGGPKEVFKRLYDGEKQKDMFRVATAQRMEGRAKFLTPNGFRYSSGPKFAYQGGYEGSFSKAKHIPDGIADKKAKRRGPDDFEQRKIYTAPLKHCSGPPPVGTFKYSGKYTPTPKIMFTEYKYYPSEYDAMFDKNKEERQKAREKTLDRPPFRVSKEIQRPSSAPTSRAPTPNVSAKSLPAADKSGGLSSRPNSAAAGRTRPVSAASQRSRNKSTGNSGAGRKGEEEERAPFRPSGATRVYKYPAYLSDPYDDRKRREAQSCGRGLPPVPPKKTTGEPPPEEPAGEEVPAWHPPGPTKTKLTKSILFTPSNLRNGNNGPAF